ncbi:MAG: glutaredoxin domain-containing protein [Acidimicrobiales bacterium]
MTEGTTGEAGITFYWRPGCGFCARLEHALVGADIPLDRHNIWEDDTAAAAVRSIARGNETVPTVVIGPVGLVNPSPNEVVEAMRRHTPELLPAGLREGTGR